MNITKIRKASEDEYDMMDFIPKTNKDINAMSDQLFAYIDGIQDLQIKNNLPLVTIPE